jgi:NAD+ diphosphatase
MEETCVPVTGARYDSSQPWPFPSSIMLGFRAWAHGSNAPRCTAELEDARWFSREEIRAGGVALLPTSYSISYRLIATWLDGK